MTRILPSHVAIIPDGNRRFAKAKNLPFLSGHTAGYEQLRLLLKELNRLSIPYVTVWAFSTENWKRPISQVRPLFSLFAKAIETFSKDPAFKQVRFVHVGRKDRLSKALLSKIQDLEQRTKRHTTMTLSIALDYGGRDEFLRASKKFVASDKKRKQLFDFLDMPEYGIPPIDLVIRTGGERRTSGFMPIASEYSEWYFSDVLFPDFSTKELHDALSDYAKRIRRFGA